MRLVLYLIALAGPLIAIVFATHAGWSALAFYYTPWAASGAVALVYLLLASVAAIVLINQKASKPERAAAAGLAALESPLKLLENAMRESPWKTIALLAGLGALAAQKPQLVANLLEALTKPAESG